MRILYLLLTMLVCSCSMDREVYYSFNEYGKEGFAFSDDYKFRLKTKEVYFQRKDKARKYGYNIKHQRFFFEIKIPF